MPTRAPLVLVVDDDPTIVEMVIAALEEAGYNAAGAVDGDALTVARALHPALILLDIMMPQMNGLEVSQRLRADPRTAAIPLVAMSAQDVLHTLARQMPIDGELPKPFDLDTLYATVQRWIPTT